jgi:hypothetical protein
MDYTIYPFEGLGAIRFGMTPQQVREVIGEPKGTHMSYGSKFPTDDYFNLGFNVHYDNELGLCDRVGISSPYYETVFDVGKLMDRYLRSIFRIYRD